MKSFIKSVLLFSVFASLFYGFAILVMGRILPYRFHGNLLTENKILSNDLSEKRFDQVGKSDSVSLAILGSSHAYRGYDVRLFNSLGFKSYNLGSSSQTPISTEFIYSNYVDKFNPKIIVIDIYPILFTKTPVEGELNLLPLFYKNEDFIQSTFKSFDVRVFNSLMYFRIFGNSESAKSKILRNEEYIDGGYISSFKIGDQTKKYTPSKLKIEDDNITALKNIVKDAEAKGIEVFLFQAPLPQERYQSYENNKEIDSIMKSIGTYYNYNEVRFLPSQYFMDDSHINQKGVDVYNKWVIDKIKENG